MNSRWRKGMRAAALLLAGALALGACGGGGGEKPGSSGTAVADTITAQVAYASRDFAPASTSGALPLAGNWHVTEALYTLNMRDFSVTNGLASGDPEKISDTEYKVTLREGAKFSDGTDVTAQDVIKSYERTTVDGSLFLPMLDFIDSVEASGDNAVTFKLNKSFPLFKERLTLIRISPASASDEDLKKMPVGSGPWKYVEITDTQVKFEKNGYYNGETPAQTKNMVWNVTVDDTARVTAMQGGKVDVMENVPANAFKTLESSGSEIMTEQGFNQAFIMFNTKQKPFDDARVRQAVLYAIDTEKLIDNQLAGQAEPVTGFLPESYVNYHKAKNVYTKDVDKAKSLLAEAGVTEPLTVTLYTTDHAWVTGLAPQIKNDLAEIGITINIESMKSSALYPTVTDKDDADFSMVLAPGDPSVFGNDPDLLMNWWFGDNVWTKQRTFWRDSEGYAKLHELMDAALATEGEQQQEYWNQCFDLLSEEVPLYPLFHRKVSTAVKKNVFDSFEAVGTTGLSFLNAKLQ